ncbi:Tethering factor [Dirofilaria immitis]
MQSCDERAGRKKGWRKEHELQWQLRISSHRSSRCGNNADEVAVKEVEVGWCGFRRVTARKYPAGTIIEKKKKKKTRWKKYQPAPQKRWKMDS